MPQRTNEFQELVDILHRHFAPANATITSSAMVKAPTGQKLREIDILIEFEAELFPFRIAVEAKDQGRPLDETIVEQYMGKYNSQGGILVNKVIIVGRSFTKGATNRAALLGFELHTLQSIEKIDIGFFAKERLKEGNWWLGKRLGDREVKIRLYDQKGRYLPPIYNSGIMMSGKMKVPVGRPCEWAHTILNNYLGEKVDSLYREYAGEMLQVIAEMELEEHYVRAKSQRVIRLSKMVLDFGERMQIPDMQAELLELKYSVDRSKKIVHEKGEGANAHVSIVYEKHDGAEHPSKFYFHSDAKEKKKIVIQLNSED